MEQIKEERARYSNDRQWGDYLDSKMAAIQAQVADHPFTIASLNRNNHWPTLGRFVKSGNSAQLEETKLFLKKFTYGIWAAYSSVSHGGYEGLWHVGVYFMEDITDQITKGLLAERHPNEIAVHIMRAAILVLSVITELQVYFGFDDPWLDMTIQKVWLEVINAYEGRDLWEERYRRLIHESRMVKVAGQFHKVPSVMKTGEAQ